MRKMRLVLLSLVLLSACSRPVAPEPQGGSEQEQPQGEIVEADYSQSTVSFRGSWGEALSHEGTFEDFVFTMTLDAEEPEDLEKASIVLDIAVDSMAMEDEAITSQLLRSDFFEAVTYPNIVFRSTKIEKVRGAEYRVTGGLIIKDIMRAITFDAEITDEQLRMQYDIDRLLFDIGGAPEDVGMDVTIPIEANIVFLQ